MPARNSLRRGTATLALLSATVVGGCAAPRTQAPAPQAESSPPLALPPDEETVLRLRARGTQNYECRAKANTAGDSEWVLVEPQADLFDSSGRKVGVHYAGPTWQSTEDGSKVTATVKTRVEAPEPDAIPWLLLTATSTTGDGALARVRSVQRTDTHGGKPPAGSCSVGQTVKVPYTAVYWFSRARP